MKQVYHSYQIDKFIIYKRDYVKYIVLTAEFEPMCCSGNYILVITSSTFSAEYAVNILENDDGSLCKKIRKSLKALIVIKIIYSWVKEVITTKFCKEYLGISTSASLEIRAGVLLCKPTKSWQHC